MFSWRKISAFSFKKKKKKERNNNPVSILRKSISGRHRPVRVADGPMTARCRFTKNASWETTLIMLSGATRVITPEPNVPPSGL